MGKSIEQQRMPIIMPWTPPDERHPLVVKPNVKRWRRKAPRKPEKDTPIIPIRGEIIFKKVA